MPFKRLLTAALSLAAIALIVAGCGGSSMTSSTSSSQGTNATASSGGASSSAVLVDSEGFTVYSFDKDSGTMSSCYGACAEAWPPVTTEGGPVKGEGAMSSKLGTTKRKDGTSQVTYEGHPLYTFVEDGTPGEDNGNGVSAFGAEWHALDGTGTAVAASTGGEGSAGGEGESTTPAPTESGSESSGGAYGY
jgi:predicted lipoprotein with Yx(FWY)xxD motif